MLVVVKLVDPELVDPKLVVWSRCLWCNWCLFGLKLLWRSTQFLHIIALSIHNVLHTPQCMLIEGCVLRLLERWVNIDITSRFSNDVTQMHAIRDGPDPTPNDLDQVLKDQGR